MPRQFSSLLLSLGIASSASAVTMDWTFVGDSGNAADDTGFGAVSYAYNVGTYEVTNAQYAEFLNAKGASDPRSPRSCLDFEIGRAGEIRTLDPQTPSLVR